MRLGKAFRIGAVGLIGCGLAASVPAAGQRTALQMLQDLQPGRWELRPYDGGGLEKLCLGNQRRLIQLRHPDRLCESVILEDTPSAVTIQYTCRGHGYGRTRIRRETARLIQFETQGVVDGQPYELIAEGRRMGDCAS